jgi:type IV pilus assembly protein PilN
MIRINLLPYREEIRKAKRQQFYSMTGMFVVLGVLIVGLVYTMIGFAIESQRDTNKILREEIAAAKKQAEEIKGIRARIQALLGRKNAIESLQSDRSGIVHLLNELTRQTPEGIYLTSIEQTGKSVTLRGYTQSSSRVSSFMRNIASSNWMASPVLIEVKAAVVNGRRLPEFALKFQVVPSKSDEAAVAVEGGES